MSKTVVAEKFRRPANSVVESSKNLDSNKLDDIYNILRILSENHDSNKLDDIYNILRILSDQLLTITDKLAFIADNMPKKLNTNFLK